MNELEKRAKYHRKRQRGLALTSLNPNAGNVEVYTKMFNKMNSPIDGPTNNPISGPFGGDVAAPSGSSDTAADTGASGGMGESLEKKSPEMIEFEYEDIIVTVYGEKRDVDDWDEWEVTTDWSYKVPKQDVEEVLLCDFMTEEDLPGIEDMEGEEQYKFVDEHFDELFAKYEDKLTEYYYEDACEDAQERYEYEPDYPEYDPYDEADLWEELHRPITKNSVLEEGMADDNFDLFLRGM